MKKKMMYSTIAILLSAFVFILYMQTGGNLIHKAKARHNLETYLEKNYKQLDYKIERGAKYVSTDDSYRFTVDVTNKYDVKTAYIFDVYNYEPFEVFNDTIHKSRIDETASARLNKSAEQYLLKLLRQDAPQLKEVATEVEVYSNEAQTKKWTPQLDMPKPTTIMLELDKGALTKAQILKQCQAMQKRLQQHSVKYVSVDAQYMSVIDGKEQESFMSFTPKSKLTIQDVGSIQ